MQLCPNCQADITGLTHHCDCCGTLINEKPGFFVWHAFMVADCGDLSIYAKEIFHSLDEIAYIQDAYTFKKIVFDIYCYPPKMVNGLKLKPYVRYSQKTQVITTRIIIDYSAYVNSNKYAKKALIANEILCSVNSMKCRTMHGQNHLDEFWTAIERILQELVEPML